MNTTLPVPSHQEWHNHTKHVKLSTGITMYYMEAGNPNAERVSYTHLSLDDHGIAHQQRRNDLL